MEKKLKHLDLIQNIVARMANNSFLLKAWSAALVSALFVLARSGTNQSFLFVAYFVVIAFAVLDAYYLRLERLFRALYNHVRELSEANIDFSMDVESFKSAKNCRWYDSCFSVSIYAFYGPLIGIMILITTQITAGPKIS